MIFGKRLVLRNAEQCNKSEKLASIRINNILGKFKQKIPLKYKCLCDDSYSNYFILLQ